MLLNNFSKCFTKIQDCLTNDKGVICHATLGFVKEHGIKTIQSVSKDKNDGFDNMQ